MQLDVDTPNASFLINGADKQARGASALYGEL